MKKILLIEDDPLVRENTSEILELAHYQVIMAENGKKGVQLAGEIGPDLILCDIVMPELDGYGVLHILSKEPLTVGVPFIFLTAKAEKSDIRKGMELGADDYLTKPIDEAELLSAVEVRLRKSELLRRQYSRSAEGLAQFLNKARGIKELKKLSAERPLVKYKKKEMIFQEGDPPQHLFFLSQGKVKTFKVHDEGKEYVTGLYRKGDYFGYAPLLENANYPDSAMAFENCEILKIPKEDFLALFYKNRDVAACFIKMLSNYVSASEKLLLSLAYDTVRKRVAGALLTLAERFSGGRSKVPRLSIHRDDLAGMAGTATETVIRTLSEFKHDHYIEIEGREIILVDREALAEIQ